MSIEATLFSTLAADAGVRAIVSSGSPLDHRIYPGVADDNAAVPYLTYQVISTSAYNLINGAPDAERKLIQINCIADSYESAKALAEAVKTALNTATGYLMGEGDDYFPDTENHRVNLDFSLIG